MNQDALVKILKTLPYTFEVYGTDKNETDSNVTLHAFSGTDFLEDLKTARAVVAGGGFSLMSEAVSLRIPMLAVPIENQIRAGAQRALSREARLWPLVPKADFGCYRRAS